MGLGLGVIIQVTTKHADVLLTGQKGYTVVSLTTHQLSFQSKAIDIAAVGVVWNFAIKLYGTTHLHVPPPFLHIILIG